MLLSLHNVHKSFLTGFANNIRRTILSWVTFQIQKWEIYGFLGINGAGKTTTLNSILGFHSIDEGQITFFGNHSLDNTIRKRLWYSPDKTPYFEHLTGRENVMLIGQYAEVEKTKKETLWLQLFDELGLTHAKDSYVQNYSQWMKQRLGLILSLINDPELIIRDEPMSGLDPLGRIVVKDLMKRLQSEWKTIIFSTHILSDVQEIADRFGILSWWKIVYESTMDEVRGNLEEFFCDIVTGEKKANEMKIQ